MTSSSKIEVGGSGLSLYSPISTLERQYAPGVGQRLFLFIATNANCCLEGGVESILKALATASSSSALPTIATEQQDLKSDTSSEYSSSDNPFSFLEEEEPTPMTTTTATADSKKKGLGLRFLQKVASNTTKSLERGMHNLAIRADQGRNPDLLMIGLYFNGNLISMTESQPMPSRSQQHPQQGGVRFKVPLVVPGELDDEQQEQDQQQQQQLTIKLWIRSGAALLQQTKAAKNYLIGSGHLSIAQLRQSLAAAAAAAAAANTTKQQSCCAVFHLTLQSALVANGILTICMTPDLKFSPPCGRGWSLTDPDPSASSGGGGMYNLALDQSYGLSLPSNPSAFLVATERSIESAMILPIATAVAQLASEACKISLAHAETTASRLLYSRHDSALGEYADVQLGIGFLKEIDSTYLPMFSNGQQLPSVAASWQRPDAIFEVELCKPSKIPVGQGQAGFIPVASTRFFPKPCRSNILPSVLQAHGGKLPPSGFLLGNVRLEFGGIGGGEHNNMLNGIIQSENPFEQQQQTSTMEEETWECIISLDQLVQRNPSSSNNSNPLMEFPVLDKRTGRQVGLVAVSLTVQLEKGPTVPATATAAQDGLVSLVGLAPLTRGVHPPLDFDVNNTQQQPSDPAAMQRLHQLATMGNFVTHPYLDYHISTFRERDSMILNERASCYQAALASLSFDQVPAHEDRTPKPFRPSSSRSEMLLSGIPFNVHTASLALNVMDPNSSSSGGDAGDSFYNTTCGAPADHARGFSNVFGKKADSSAAAAAPDMSNMGLTSPVGSVSGGLRRLEAKRQEIADQVTNLQTALISEIANHFMLQRQQGQAGHNKVAVSHVPARNYALQGLRWKVFEAVQSLHHVTWICAMRRASVFSQALGIAMSNYLTSLSNPVKLQSTFPDIWARHGYLVSFEGLLSAAGKELGMIEDASVAVSMLRMVKVVLVPDDGNTSGPSSRIAVPGSPYLKYMDLSTCGQNAEREFTLQIGLVPSYYEQRIPAAVKNGIPVRLYPILFEVGVDIRQWGANAGSNMKTQFDSQLDRNTNGCVSSGQEKTASKDAFAGGLIDDEDDDVGVADYDVLVQLNYEAFQKLNRYAYLVSPANSQQTMASQRTHPLLETLYQHIVSSAGKMNHDILDEAAALVQQLGGGAAVFCKSGKDRTAMHVTFKMAQFANRYREIHGASSGSPVVNRTLDDAMMIRLYGTRLPICEKNVGQAKYAFNSLQVKFMPDALKPPMNALAGFLKGGKIFTGGGIES